MKDKIPIRVYDIMEWIKRSEENKAIKKTTIEGTYISTVFLGLDHNLYNVGPPLLFETMIFGDVDYENYQERYSTWDQACEGHEYACNMMHEYYKTIKGLKKRALVNKN